MSGFLIVAGFWLLITTPNHPGAPTDPALHPALHLFAGAVALAAGVALVVRRILLGGGS